MHDKGTATPSVVYRVSVGSTQLHLRSHEKKSMNHDKPYYTNYTTYHRLPYLHVGIHAKNMTHDCMQFGSAPLQRQGNINWGSSLAMQQ